MSAMQCARNIILLKSGDNLQSNFLDQSVVNFDEICESVDK